MQGDDEDQVPVNPGDRGDPTAELAELVNTLTEVTISAMALARDRRALGDSEYLTGAEMLDMVDANLDYLEFPSLREAVVNHVRAIVRAAFLNEGADRA